MLQPMRRGFAAILVLGLAVAACGGSSASATRASGDGSGGGTASSSAPNASTPAEPTAEPTDAAQPTDAAASPATGGNGGTGNGAIPALSNGQWTAGKVHADVTGDVADTVDGVITSGLALTDQQNTTLTYFSSDATKQVAVALAGGTAAVSVTTPQWNRWRRQHCGRGVRHRLHEDRRQGARRDHHLQPRAGPQGRVARRRSVRGHRRELRRIALTAAARPRGTAGA